MITTVTMNAALDKAYFMSGKIVNGTVMRVTKTRTSAGGKGLNVARVVALCGEEVKAAGLVGGYNGRQLEHLLEKDGIRHQFVHMSGETRCCINILDPEYGSTEYLEPGCEVKKEEEQNFLEKFPEIIKDSEIITISGSIPGGLEKDIYRRMVSVAKEAGKTVILDSSGETLQKGLAACPDLVKPNIDEMEQLFGVQINSITDVVTYAEKIRAMGPENVVISMGKDGALFLCKDGNFVAKPPKVDVVNTVGCGDSMVAAFAVAFLRNYTSEEALKYAVSVATANAMTPNTGDFDPETAEEVRKQIIVEKL